MKIVVIPGLFLSERAGRRVVQNVAVTRSAENITVKLKLLPGPEGLFVPVQVGEVLVLEVEQVKAGAGRRGSCAGGRAGKSRGRGAGSCNGI